MNIRTLRWAAALNMLLLARSAFAWDSDTRLLTRNMLNSAKPLLGAPPFYDSTSGTEGTRFLMTTLKDAIGGIAPNGSDGITPNQVFICDPTIAAGKTVPDLSLCKPATSGDLFHQKWAWLEIRKQANADHDSEHFLIAKASASFAGFDSTTVFQPFWIRYPTQNSMVISPLDTDSGYLRPGTSYIMSQSWSPAASLETSVQAVRGISLLELAQLPDFSNSVADWAAGNETCPVPKTSGAFDSSFSEVQACHQFDLLSGAINVTHFAPYNRQVWRYYHQLAMQRMNDCNQLAVNLGSFYQIPGAGDTTPPLYQPLPSTQTEVHECESEAMVYEMFAQHFLQDSWSTGHMWKRWGYPNFEDFPADVTGSVDFPPENEQPRRAAIALLIAAFSGTIHGAKPVVRSTIIQYGGPFAGLAKTRLVDDPLSAPDYPSLFLGIPSIVQWQSPDQKLHNGAGDLFWDSSDRPTRSVNNSPDFQDQKLDVIKCGAASMLEVYNRGPQQHGKVTQNSLLNGVLPDSDACWGNWATNDSMLSALGPVSGMTGFYDQFDPLAKLKVSSVANAVVSKLTSDKTGFVSFNARGQKNPHFAQLYADKLKFLAQVNARLVLDNTILHAGYFENALVDPDGTDSAHGTTLDGRTLSMLGIEPAADAPLPLPSDPPQAPLTKYADMLVSQFSSTVPVAGSLTAAPSQLFWRGNLPLTCRSSVAGGAAKLLALQAQCIAGASGGGSPDSCTACTELAEIHVPGIDEGASPTRLTDSKCSAVGAESVAAPPAGLPSYWFDVNYRTEGGPDHTHEGLGLPGFYIAMEWCTGTKFDGGDTNGPQDGLYVFRDSLITKDITAQTDCPVPGIGGLVHNTYGIEHRRQAQALVEDFGDSPFLYPVVTAFNYDYTETLSGDPCTTGTVVITDGRVQHYSDAVAPAPFSEFMRARASFLMNATMEAQNITPRCGVQQRMSYWNRDCGTATKELGIVLATGNDALFSPSTGGWQIPVAVPDDPELGPQSFCFIREQRVFKPTCPSGLSFTAGGECNYLGAPPVAEFITAEPPPEAN